MAWYFKLIITNGTDRNLKVASKQKPWGSWYRGGKKGAGPAGIAAGETIEALGVRAGDGPSGYECSATWTDDTPKGARSYGSVSVYVDVPWIADNASSCHSSGGLFVDGWQKLPKSRHNFVRNITIATEVVGLATEDTVADDEDVAYEEYLEAFYAQNPDVEDWDEVVEKVPETDSFVPTAMLPKQYEVPPKRIVVARLEPYDIDPADMAGVGDPQYPNLYSKQLNVEKYFATALYSVNTDPRSVISLAKGQKTSTKEVVSVTSALRSALETTWSIGASLSGERGDPKKGLAIAGKLEGSYSVTNVMEKSTTRVHSVEKEQSFEAKDSDLLIVPWVFSKAILLYRVNKSHKTKLVAISEFAETQLFKSYPY